MKAFALIYFLYEICALGELLFFFIKKVHSSSQIQCQQYQTQRFQAAIVHLIRVKIHRREDELLVLKEEIFRKKNALAEVCEESRNTFITSIFVLSMQAFGRDQSGTGRIVSTVRMQNVPCLVLVLAALAYLVPGILGHDPWKQDETYTFGIIYHMLTSGDWGIPVNAG